MAITLRSNSKLEEIEKKLSNVFDNKSSGAEFVLDAWQYLRQRTIIVELKGKFTDQEIYYLVDVFNGTIIEPRFSCSNDFIIAQVEDGATFDNLDKKWKVDLQQFLGKIQTLTSAQSYFLLEEINRFWNKESNKENSLNSFVKTLI